MMRPKIVDLLRGYKGINITNASRNDVLFILNSILAYEKATPLIERPTQPAVINATVKTLVGSSDSNDNSNSINYCKQYSTNFLTHKILTAKVPLSLWTASLPWEISKGYSLTPASVVNGYNGKPLSINFNINDVNNNTDEDSDDLSIISQKTAPDLPFNLKSSNINNDSEDDCDSGKNLFKYHEILPPSAASNGMLFLHREDAEGSKDSNRGPPTFWSGGITTPIDVIFLTAPTPERLKQQIELTPESKAYRNNNRRAGYSCYNKISNNYILLDKMCKGYGPLDDPGPYDYFIRNGEPMKLSGQTLTYLDPFSPVLEAVNEGIPFNGDHERDVFPGLNNTDNDDDIVPKRYRCKPSSQLDSSMFVTSILEVRRRLFKDIVASFGLANIDNNYCRANSTRKKEIDNEKSRNLLSPDKYDDSLVIFDVELSIKLMKELEIKEFLYREMVLPLQIRVNQLLLQLHTEEPQQYQQMSQKQSEEEDNNCNKKKKFEESNAGRIREEPDECIIKSQHGTIEEDCKDEIIDFYNYSYDSITNDVDNKGNNKDGNVILSDNNCEELISHSQDPLFTAHGGCINSLLKKPNSNVKTSSVSSIPILVSNRLNNPSFSNKTPASKPSYTGTEGSFSLSKARLVDRYSPTSPVRTVLKPVDLPLLCAAYRLGMAHNTFAYLYPRLLSDLQEREDKISDNDVMLLLEIVRDPSVPLYPQELVRLILKIASDRGIEVSVSLK